MAGCPDELTAFTPMGQTREDFLLSATRYGVGISWTSGGPLDLDLQAVVVDQKGLIIDAVYYNNLKALRAITHSGDEQHGDKAGLQETIWISLSRLPPHVKLIIFVVAAYSGGGLKDASNGLIHVLEEKRENEVARLAMEQTDRAVDAVAMMIRTEAGWIMRPIEEPALSGRHFIDILEPTLGNLIRGVIPDAPKRQKVAFAMEKGTVVDLPQTSSLGSVSAGLGWDMTEGSGDIDLDVSAVLVTGDLKVKGAVFFGNIEEFGLLHSGDNLTGEGEGDDEVISANLAVIPADVQQIVFVVNVYTQGVSFEQVSNAYCRIFSSVGDELARYELRDGRGERGLIIARLLRETAVDGGRWSFQALGRFCRGQTWKDSVGEILAVAKHSAQELGARVSPPRIHSEGAVEPRRLPI